MPFFLAVTLISLLAFLSVSLGASSFEATFLSDFSQASITDSAAPLNVIPYPRAVTWPGGSCSRVGLASGVAGLSALSGLPVGVSARFQARVAALANATIWSRSSSGGQVDGVTRQLNFAAVTWSQIVVVPRLGDNESYTLSLQTRSSFVDVRIGAVTSTGVVRALALLLQLATDSSSCIPVGLAVSDAPAFSWRGAGIDVARRYHDLATLRRVCDGLEFARMNVLHLHLTDDQGWRFESRLWPRLHQVGTRDGKYYTQADLTALVAYCALGGVRVVPEVDFPGHSAAALVAYPVLAPYHYPLQVPADWGVYDYTLDVTQPICATFVRDILSELAAVFQDTHVHVGGDEVTWPSFTTQQSAWMSAAGVTKATLQKYFQSQIVFPALAAVGKVGMGWDDMFAATGDGGASLPPTFVVEWWRSVSLDQRVPSVVATGLYLDSLPLAELLYAAQFVRAGDLGAEATLWSESIGDNAEPRMFPSLLAFAEAMWRGQNGQLSVRSMLYRLFAQSTDGLGVFGLKHREVYETQIKALFAGTSWSLSALVGKFSQDTTLTDLLVPSALFSPAPTDALDDVMDAARPVCAAGYMLTWLAEKALNEEKLNPAGKATTLLKVWLQRLASGKNQILRTSGMNAVQADMSSVAGSYLAWIEAVQFGKDGSDLRQQALAAGSSTYSGIYDTSLFVYNQLKEQVGVVLLARNVGPYNYGVVETLTPTPPVVVDDSWRVIVGATLGVVCFVGIVAAVCAAVFFVRRRSRALLLTETAPLEMEPIVVVDGVDLDESYVDYMGDDAESEYSAIGGRSNKPSYSTGSEAATPHQPHVEPLADGSDGDEYSAIVGGRSEKPGKSVVSHFLGELPGHMRSNSPVNDTEPTEVISSTETDSDADSYGAFF